MADYSTYHPYARVYRRPFMTPFPLGVSLGTTGLPTRSAASRLLDIEYDFPSKYERRAEINRLKSKRRLEAMDFGLLPYNSWSTYLKPIPRYYINDNRDYYLGDYYPLIISRYPVRPLRMVHLAPLSVRAIPIADSSLDALTLDIESEEARIQAQHEARRIRSAVWQSEATDKAIRLCKDRNRIRNQLRRIDNARMIAPIYSTLGETKLGTRHKVLINYHKGAAAAAHQQSGQDEADRHSAEATIGQKPKKEFRDEGIEIVNVPLPRSPTKEVITNGFAEDQTSLKTAEESKPSFSVGEEELHSLQEQQQVDVEPVEEVSKKKKSKKVEPEPAAAESETHLEKKSKPKKEYKYESSKEKRRREQEKEQLKEEKIEKPPETVSKVEAKAEIEDQKQTESPKPVEAPQTLPVEVEVVSLPEPETDTTISNEDTAPVEQEEKPLVPPETPTEDKVSQPLTTTTETVPIAEPEPEPEPEDTTTVSSHLEVHEDVPEDKASGDFDKPSSPELIAEMEPEPSTFQKAETTNAEMETNKKVEEVPEIESGPPEAESVCESPTPLKTQVSTDETAAKAEMEPDMPAKIADEPEPIFESEVSAAPETETVEAAETTDDVEPEVDRKPYESQISVDNDPSKEMEAAVSEQSEEVADEPETVLRRLISTASCKEGDACDESEWDDANQAPMESPRIEPTRKIILSASDDAIPMGKGDYEDAVTEDETAPAITTEEPSTTEDSNIDPCVEEPDEETEKYDDNAEYKFKSLSIEEDG